MEMSAVPPDIYAKRFFEFMSKQVIINQITKDHKANNIEYNNSARKSLINGRKHMNCNFIECTDNHNLTSNAG